MDVGPGDAARTGGDGGHRTGDGSPAMPDAERDSASTAPDLGAAADAASSADAVTSADATAGRRDGGRDAVVDAGRAQRDARLAPDAAVPDAAAPDQGLAEPLCVEQPECRYAVACDNGACDIYGYTTCWLAAVDEQHIVVHLHWYDPFAPRVSRRAGGPVDGCGGHCARAGQYRFEVDVGSGRVVSASRATYGPEWNGADVPCEAAPAGGADQVVLAGRRYEVVPAAEWFCGNHWRERAECGGPEVVNVLRDVLRVTAVDAGDEVQRITLDLLRADRGAANP